MATQVSFKRGKKENLKDLNLKDGQLSITLDEGVLYYDYVAADGSIQRKRLLPGKLTIGDKTFDGTEDVNVDTYEGDYDTMPSNYLF